MLTASQQFDKLGNIYFDVVSDKSNRVIPDFDYATFLNSLVSSFIWGDTNPSNKKKSIANEIFKSLGDNDVVLSAATILSSWQDDSIKNIDVINIWLKTAKFN